MSQLQFKTIENAGRHAAMWTEGFDGERHYADVLKALAPASFILAVAAALMVAIL